MKKILSAAALAIFLAGCATPETTHITYRTFQAIPVDQVEVVANPSTNWVRVAELSAQAMGSSQQSADDARKALIKEAASLGANRLVLRRGNVYPGRAYWMNAWGYREGE